ncbi:LysR family transcriptional regulator [Streptomyces sp. ME19-01-6]|uniref:LysR family transcriptional regulator n=1 Tax=Streptomyces sp. ME19-01-6 TaxID=3028686 RepID=UPI0029B68422|nr:LysR substrate-binding domain-containing protein [Streptomyces sp. ME19-01-6]MDX3228080.1 LysR substrate-binding domain-containing protein [Streptomyces sp. ME19-01-6]
MELRQLEYFVAVVEEANFTRAAERLHVAQPGVSAQIRRLEHELGQELLDRSGRSVRPTEVGAAVLPYARAALSAVSGVRLAVEELTGLVRGHVAIGTVTSHNVDLPTLLAEFHEDHPAVEITLIEDSSDRLVDALRGGRLDAAIIACGTTPPADLGIHIVTQDAVVAAVSRDHELAKRSTIPLDALRDRVLISLPLGTGIRSLFDEACATAGFTPHIAFEAGTPTVLAELAARGLGIAIVPSGIARRREDLRTLAITRPALRGALAFAWRAEGPISPAARALVGRARRLIGG